MFSKRFSSFKPVFPCSPRGEQVQVHANSLQRHCSRAASGAPDAGRSKSGITPSPLPSALLHSPHPPCQMLTLSSAGGFHPCLQVCSDSFPPEIEKLQKDSQLLCNAELQGSHWPKRSLRKLPSSAETVVNTDKVNPGSKSRNSRR